MGVILESTDAMGEYHVEVRRESFYLRGEDTYNGRKHHAIDFYPDGPNQDILQGTVEILIEDIPKIRAALDAVEEHLRTQETS